MEENKKNHKKKSIGSNPENLPNARAGYPYRTQISGDCLPSNPLAVCWVDGIEKTGLHFFPEKKQITGIPQKSGSFDMQLNVRVYNESGIEELSTHTLKLIVEDDIDFKLGEADENDPYWKRDEDVYDISVNRKKKMRLKKDLSAASRRGHQHIEKGKIREDDFYIRYDTNTRWYVLAVADGSGKAKYSRKGSEIACRSVVETCLEQLTKQSRRLRRLAFRHILKKSEKIRNEIIKRLHDVMTASVTTAYQAIVTEAADFKRHPDDYATTLLMCICKKFEFGWLIGAFGAGDGAVCVYRKDEPYANLMGGGDAPSAKCFLTKPGIVQPSELDRRIRFTIIDDFSALFLMTNGVSDPKFGSKDLSSIEKWNKFWDDICSEVNFSGKTKSVSEDLLKWLDFWTPGKYDDRTIAVVF
jgi:hypothetical protein